jgi:hypothetical protein
MNRMSFFQTFYAVFYRTGMNLHAEQRSWSFYKELLALQEQG